MKTALIEQNNEQVFMIELPQDYRSGCISSSGKSLVYRIGTGDYYSPYKQKKLPFVSRFAGSFTPIQQAVDYDFGDGIVKAIPIRSGILITKPSAHE